MRGDPGQALQRVQDLLLRAAASVGRDDRADDLLARADEEHTARRRPGPRRPCRVGDVPAAAAEQRRAVPGHDRLSAWGRQCAPGCAGGAWSAGTGPRRRPRTPAGSGVARWFVPQCTRCPARATAGPAPAGWVIVGPVGWVAFGGEDVVHPAAAIAAVRRIAARWSAARIIAADLDRLTCWTPAAARRFRPPGGAGQLPHGQQALDDQFQGVPAEMRARASRISL